MAGRALPQVRPRLRDSGAPARRDGFWRLGVRAAPVPDRAHGSARPERGPPLRAWPHRLGPGRRRRGAAPAGRDARWTMSLWRSRAGGAWTGLAADGLGTGDPPRRPVLFVNPRSGGGAGPRIAEQAEKRGITVNEFAPIGSSRRWSTRPLRAEPTRWQWRVATGRWRRWPPLRAPPAVRLRAGGDPQPLRARPRAESGRSARGARCPQRRGRGPNDVGEVNDRVFLNNVSLGIYAEAVRKSVYRAAKVRTLVDTAHAVLGPGTEVPGLDFVDDLGVTRAPVRRSCSFRTIRMRWAGRARAVPARR